MRFKRTRRGVESKLTAVEAAVLAQCAGELLELLGEGRPGSDDPLAALVGLPPEQVRRPEDPALARLFPDAYGPSFGDAGAADEFRRYTEADLRAGKRAAAAELLRAVQPLVAGGGRLLLDREQADSWLAGLNDLRLVLGTRLAVTEESAQEELAPGNPAWQLSQVYNWLGWLQESLISCLDPRSQG